MNTSPQIAEQGAISAVESAHAAYISSARVLDIFEKPNDYALLAALSLSHFFNDFCIGIAAPMIPAMERKFNLTLGGIAGILILTSLVSNFTQPVAGWVMERTRTAVMLLVCPFFCALTFMVGWTTHPWQAKILFCMAGVANGAFHPFSYILAQLALPRRPSLSTAIFISFGFLGVSSGAMVSGHWMENLQFGGFHWLYLGAFVTVAALLIRGIQTVELAPYLAFIHPPKNGANGEHASKSNNDPRIPFGLIWMAGFLMAFEGGTVMFFTPKFFKVLYQSEGLGGDACFIFGVIGGIFSYFYAHLADRRNPFRIVMIVQALSIFPFAGFFYFPSAPAKLAMIALAGTTAGATLPVMTSLARGSRGLTVGLRTSLMLGGIWGATAILHYGMAQLPDHGVALGKVMSSLCVAPMIAVALLFYASRRYASA